MSGHQNAPEEVPPPRSPAQRDFKSVEIVRRVSTELEQLSNDLHLFQHDLSELLTQREVSAHLMRRIQSLDDTTQRLHALSQVTQAMASPADEIVDLSQSKMEALVPLGALRDRLMGDRSACESEGPDHGHVSLF